MHLRGILIARAIFHLFRIAAFYGDLFHGKQVCTAIPSIPLNRIQNTVLRSSTSMVKYERNALVYNLLSHATFPDIPLELYPTVAVVSPCIVWRSSRICFIWPVTVFEYLSLSFYLSTHLCIPMCFMSSSLSMISFWFKEAFVSLLYLHDFYDHS